MSRLFTKKGGRIIPKSTNIKQNDIIFPPTPPTKTEEIISISNSKDLSGLFQFHLGKVQKSRIPQNNIKIHF